MIDRAVDVSAEGEDSEGSRKTKNDHIPRSRVKTDMEKNSDLGDVELEEFFADDGFFERVGFNQTHSATSISVQRAR